MTTEERLTAVLREADAYQPSPDLWTRVLYSIEEDAAHRRRVWRTVAAVAGALALVATVALLSILSPARPGLRAHVDWRILEILETAALFVAIAALGPAVRRFGRGYLSELFVTSPETADRMLRLIDVAYYLVFAGYVMITARFAAPASYVVPRLGLQIYEALTRLGGLLLLMGLLHAATFMVLPLVALVFNSTRAGRPLPRWVVLVVTLGFGAAAFLFVILLLGAGSPS